jgi:hypothetical protein
MRPTRDANLPLRPDFDKPSMKVMKGFKWTSKVAFPAGDDPLLNAGSKVQIGEFGRFSGGGPAGANAFRQRSEMESSKRPLQGPFKRGVSTPFTHAHLKQGGNIGAGGATQQYPEGHPDGRVRGEEAVKLEARLRKGITDNLAVMKERQERLSAENPQWKRWKTPSESRPDFMLRNQWKSASDLESFAASPLGFLAGAGELPLAAQLQVALGTLDQAEAQYVKGGAASKTDLSGAHNELFALNCLPSTVRPQLTLLVQTAWRE